MPSSAAIALRRSLSEASISMAIALLTLYWLELGKSPRGSRTAFATKVPPARHAKAVRATSRLRVNQIHRSGASPSGPTPAKPEPGDQRRRRAVQARTLEGPQIIHQQQLCSQNCRSMFRMPSLRHFDRSSILCPVEIGSDSRLSVTLKGLIKLVKAKLSGRRSGNQVRCVRPS